MSAARTASLLFKSVGTALAVVVLMGMAWTANAQTNWPPSAPPLAAESGPVQLTEDEINYYGVVLSKAVEAGKITETMKEQAFNLALTCYNDPDCSDARKTEVRRMYVSRIRNAAAEGYLPGTTTSPPTTPGTGGETSGGDPGTGEGTESEGGTSAIGAGEASDGCSFVRGNILTCVQSVGGKIGASILWIFVSLFGWMLGVVGVFFNWVMLVTVFQFATYFGNSAGILLAWSVLRDVGNIMLLFGFIFIGLQTILNIGHFNVGKALPRLVIFAILINFSLFVSEAIVDISNAFSASFYTYAADTNCTVAWESEKCTGSGIAGKVLAAAGLAEIFSLNGLSEFTNIWSSDDGIQMFVLYAGLCIFMIVMMITLGAAAIMFVIRAITLMLLLVVSPLGFAGMAIPQFEEQSSKWWKMLISQSFFAPIYLLMIFVGLKIMEGAQAVFNEGGKGTITEALSSTTVSSGGVFILFALMIGFMIAAMTMAKSFGAVGASFAVNTSSKLVGRATLGTAGFVGRRTLGWGAGKLGEAAERNKFLQRHSGLSRMVLAGTDMASKASYDGRKAISGLPGVKKSGIDLGAANKTAAHGYHGIHEKATKEREAWEKRQKITSEEEEKAKAQEATAREATAEIRDISDKKKAKLQGTHDAIQNEVNKLAEMRKAKVSEADLAVQKNIINELERRYAREEEAFNNTQSGILERQDNGQMKNVSYAERMKTLQARQKQWSGRAKETTARAKADMTEGMIEGYENSAHSFVGKISAGGHADHEAAERLRAGGKLSDTEKALATISKQLKQNDENEAKRDAHADENEAKRDKKARDQAADSAHAGDDHH